MTSLVLITYDKITDHYRDKEFKQNQELMLVKNHGMVNQFNWVRYPVLITEEEKKTMNFKHVINILSGSCKSPSQLAGLDSTDLDDVIRAADRIFEMSLVFYKEEVNQSVNIDKEEIRFVKKRHKFFIVKTTFGGVLSGGALGAVGGTGFCPGIGTAIGAVGGAVVLGVPAFVTAIKIWKQTILRCGSAARIKCLQVINTCENHRLKELKSCLKLRANVLLTDLIDFEKEGQTELLRFKYLKQISKVVEAIFPEEKLIIDDVNIPEYLTYLSDKFAIQIT